MKQMKYLAFLLMAGMTLVACEDDDKIAGIDLTDHSVMTLTFEGNQWDALIDNPQYNGPLLYGENAKNYAWTDEETKLHGQMTNAWGGMYGFSEGGIAISNYIDADFSTERSYDIQLAVPASNGSKNFAVVYCDADLTFADGVAREIKKIDFIATTYMLSIAQNGNKYAKPLTGEGEYANLVVTGYNGEEKVGYSRIVLAMEDFKLDKWYSHSFSWFGKVTRLHFSLEGTDTGTPAYVAFDNVVVKK